MVPCRVGCGWVISTSRALHMHRALRLRLSHTNASDIPCLSCPLPCLAAAQNFMNNDPKAVAIISEYMARRSGSHGSSKPTASQPPSSSSGGSGAARQGPAGSAAAGGAHAGRVATSSQPSPSKQPATKQQQQQQQGGTPDSWLVLDKHGQHLAGSSQQQQEAGSGPQEVAGPSSGSNLKSIDAAKATLSMFKQGGRLRSRGEGRGGGGGADCP